MIVGSLINNWVRELRFVDRSKKGKFDIKIMKNVNLENFTQNYFIYRICI